MLKVMIVDDEIRIIQGMRMLIDWEALGYTIVAEAYNGQEGLEKAIVTSPDIVIADIRMPVMDGHQMIRNIKRFLPDCYMIILSGYGEFEYAKQAIKDGVYEYLLKPVDRNELTEVLNKIKKEIAEVNSLKEEFNNLKKQQRKNISIVREKYLREIISNDRLKEERIFELWSNAGLNKRYAEFCMMVIELDCIDCVTYEDLEDVNLMKFAIVNVMEELFSSDCDRIVFNCDNHRIAILLCGEKKDGSIHEIACNMFDICSKLVQNIFTRSISTGISRSCLDLAGIRESYLQAVQALEYKLIYGDGSLIKFDEVSKNKPATKIVLPEALENELLLYVELGQTDNAIGAIDGIFDYIKMTDAYDPKSIHSIFQNILTSIMRIGISSEAYDENKAEEYMECVRILNSSLTFYEIRSNIKSWITEVSDSIAGIRNIKSKGAFLEIKRYIEEHYYEDLTLEALSKKFFINSTYLSSFLKKELGYNYIDFLTGIRIEKSKRLLQDQEFKIYEIASMVGYKNHRYFRQVFKKNTGLSPMDYRKSKISE